MTAVKSPVKSNAGRLGGVTRWGADHDAKVVRIDALTPEQRQLVMALIRAAKDQALGKAEKAP